MRSLLLICAFGCITLNSNAQTTEDSVKAVVNKMFDAMRNSDAAMLQSAFGDSALLQTISRSKEGKTVVRNESIAAFAGSISGAPKGALDERISFETVKIDGALALAWTPYSFYYNGKFSHCGVNSFQLVRIDGAWKIQYIIDTRRKTGCIEN
ncbi:MAG: nuclear transport factor 2 family protein [Rhizobacter sp.]|nr:nuclear transport factor 2 family protein [Ferruginibacter sp.]